MTNNTQLPAEILNKISLDAENLYNELDEKAMRVDCYDFGLPMFKKIKKPIIKLLTEYATKLHQAQQEIEQLKRWKAESSELLNPILEYGQSKEAGIKLGESITAIVLERCKQHDKARAIIEKINGRYGALHHELLANEIKTFLDGKK